MALSNSQFDAIMRVYNQRQFLNKRRQDERIREVYERIPQVEALTDEIAAAMAQAARRKLLGDEDGARAFKEEASLLKEQKRKYLQRAGYPDDYMEMQYHCPCCRDTGFADGKKCRCFRQMEIQVLYDQSNIREVLERENFDTLSMGYYDRERIDSRVGMTVYDYMSMVIGECKAYVENFGREKGKYPVHREHWLRKDLPQQLHCPGAFKTVLFGGVPDGHRHVRYPVGKPLRRPGRGGGKGPGGLYPGL